jgi:hypothetical protein
MSTDGIQQQYIPASLDGLVYVDVDGLTVNGVPVDLDNLVPYTNATKNLNLGTFNFETLGGVSAPQHVFTPFTSTLMTGAMTSSIFTADAWGFANTISTVSLSPTVTASYLTLKNITNNNTVVTFKNDGSADFGNTKVRVSTMASNVYDVVNLSTLQASVAFIENVNALNYVPYTGATDNLNMGASTITTTGLINAGALRITSSISNTDYSVSVNGTDFLEFTNLTSLQKVYTDGDSIWIPNRIFCNSTIYTNDLQMGNTIYFSYGTGQQWGTTINGSAEYEIQDDLGAMRLRLSKSTGLTVSTLNITNVPSATPTLALGVNGSGGVVSFAVPSGASFPFTGTTNINGGLQTLQNATQFNPSLDANSYFVTGVFPTTYVFTTNWTVNPVSGTEANVALDPAVFYFDTNHKYIISFTGIYGTGATWVGTVFNSSTATTVSDASIAITTSPQNLSITFTAGSSNPAIYLRFVGSSGTLRFTNFTIKEVDVEILGNIAFSSEIDSNIVQSNGRTTNLAGGLKVNQTSVATAPTLTTASLPAGVSASSLSGSYTLTATAGGANFGMWLGSSFTYIAGAKYTFTFTGFSTNATATQAMILYTNTYTGGIGTFIGDYIVNVPITSSTVSGSFTATSNNNVVFNFISSAAGRSISFTGFTLTRADTQITGIATLPTNTGTIVAGLGLNSSNQIVSYSASGNPDFSAVSVGYVPYESASNVFSNSLMTVGTNSLGYSGGSFTASTGIASITFSSPTYSANSNASFQGIITLPALPTTALNTACIATITASAFPVFAVAPYPYFTLTSGATVVYTSPVGSPGTVSMPFTPTSTTLFITLYFKAPPTGFTGSVFTWTNFTITTPSMITTGYNTVTGRLVLDGTGATEIYNGRIDAYNATGNNNLMIRSWWGIGFPSYDNIVRIGMDTRTGNADFGGAITTGGNITMASGTFRKNSSANPNNWAAIQEGGAANSPYVEFYYGSLRRGYIGNATASVLQLVAENNCDFNLITGGSVRMIATNAGDIGIGRTPGYKFDVGGSMRVKNVLNADDSMCYYGENATWNSRLVVGAGTDKSAASTAQVITTDGNLHMDAGNSKDMYYGYYPNSRGTPNTHRFYGSGIYFGSGLPQQDTTAIAPICFNGSQLFRSANIHNIIYSSNSVGWSGGINTTYAFYRTNGYVATMIHGKCSYYVGGSTMAYPNLRVYSQNTGQYWYYDLRNFTNNGSNHVTFPFQVIFNSNNTTAVGWFDVYFYSGGNLFTDSNDQLWILADTGMSSQFV